MRTSTSSEGAYDRLAVYVTTGAPVPDGYTTVVPIEQIKYLQSKEFETEDEDQARYFIIKKSPAIKEGQFIRQPGSDI